MKRGIAGAMVFTASLAAASCTGEDQPHNDQQSRSPEATATANVCDATPEELVSDYLDIPAGLLQNLGCIAVPEQGISAQQTWEVASDELAGARLVVSFSGPDATPFNQYYDQYPEASTGQVEIAGKDVPYISGDAFIAAALDDGVLTTAITTEASPQPRLQPDAQTGETNASEVLIELTQMVAGVAGTEINEDDHIEPDPQAPTPTTTTTQPPAPDSQISDEPCVIYYDSPNCSSTNPTVQTGMTFVSDTSGCQFSTNVSWGDGTEETYNTAGGPEGRRIAARHTYTRPGTYTISSQGTVTQGTCWTGNSAKTFTFSPDQPTSPCEAFTNYDIGRTYTHTLIPRGTLRRSDDNEPLHGTDNLDWGDEYIDEAGMRWKLERSFASKYHQPTGWSEISDAINLKLISDTDSSGGSFEAILAPDGTTPDMTAEEILATGPLTYSNNYIINGRGVGTYNHDTMEGITDVHGFMGHYLYDMAPHTEDPNGDKRYVFVPPHRVMTAEPGDRWRTYNQRLRQGLGLILDNGYQLEGEAGSYVLRNGSDTQAVLDDIVPLLQEAQDCPR